MDSVSDVLKKFNPLIDKYVSREFQTYGVFLAEKLEDEGHKALYIKYAKTLPRPVLEEALRFVIDSNAKRKGALFMWKLKEMGAIGKPKAKSDNKKEAEKKKEQGERLF
ncbi:MAG TPA: hypothetical protein VK338_00390 [Candidatus Nitrosocosmicus sp.]|nr:hypothetical protein [Candidatus Nitrosocosmicus sp.]